MGARDFLVKRDGVDATATFLAAVEEAAYEHGHGGYTGTIAEKHEVVVIQSVPVSESAARDLARNLLDADDERIRDKWGPAGAIAVGDGKVSAWIFFGFASS